MKKPFTAAVMAVAVIAMSEQAMACTGCGCSLNTDDTIQGGSAGWHVDERFDYINQSKLQIGGLKAPTQDPTTGLEVQKSTMSIFYTTTLDYQAEGPWGLNLAVPFQYRQHSTYNDSDYTPSKSQWNELSDVRLVGRFTGLLEDRSLGLQLGMKLPTGQTNQVFYSGGADQVGVQVDRGLQPGTGTWDVLLGAFKNGHVTEDVSWFSTILWQKPLGQDQGFAEGQKLTGTLGIRYAFSALLVPQLQVNLQNRWRDEGINADIPNSGGQLINLSPGLFVNVRDDLSVYGFVQIPVYQRVGGLELVPDYTASVGVKYKF